MEPFDQYINHLLAPIQFTFSDEYNDKERYLGISLNINGNYYNKNTYYAYFNDLQAKAADDIKQQYKNLKNRKILIASVNHELTRALKCFNYKRNRPDSSQGTPKKQITLFFEGGPDEPSRISESDYFSPFYFNVYIEFINYQYISLLKFKNQFNKYILELNSANRLSQTFVCNFQYTGTSNQEDAFKELLDTLKQLYTINGRAIVAPQTQINQLKQLFGIGNKAAKMVWYCRGDLQTFLKNGIKPLLRNKPVVYDWQTKIDLVGASWKNFNSYQPAKNQKDIDKAIELFKNKLDIK
jgi:hypothetical protein